MQVQTFEIRDRATFIPALAIRFKGEDSWLFWRAGFGLQDNYVILVNLESYESNYDSHGWKNFRTMGNAHQHLIKHWDDEMAQRKGMESPVIDVEYILGETTVKKESEAAR